VLSADERARLRRREFDRAFVLMQFFGYLGRDPDAAPDTDLRGWEFRLAKLEEFGGDYRRAEMVKAFLESVEYSRRFGRQVRQRTVRRRAKAPRDSSPAPSPVGSFYTTITNAPPVSC
jgi:hypothetical protein